MTMAKQKVGDGPCPVCKERVVWRLSDSGALSCFCQDCDFQGYAKSDTLAKRKLMEVLKPAGAQLNPAPPKEKPAAPPPKPGIFGLGGF
jgi:hypothetical protein